jgi:hypothetical protein
VYKLTQFLNQFKKMNRTKITVHGFATFIFWIVIPPSVLYSRQSVSKSKVRVFYNVKLVLSIPTSQKNTLR